MFLKQQLPDTHLKDKGAPQHPFIPEPFSYRKNIICVS